MMTLWYYGLQKMIVMLFPTWTVYFIGGWTLYHKFLSSNSNSCCKYISAVIHNFDWCFFARKVLVEPGREKGSSKSTLLNDRVRSVWCNYCINNERHEAETCGCGCDDSTIVTQSLTSATARLCGADVNQPHDLQRTLASDYA